jgi:hypothetical protein
MQQNKKTLPKSLPFLSPSFASHYESQPQPSPPTFLLIQPFLLPLVISWLQEYYVGLMHLELRQMIPDLVHGEVANKGCNPFCLKNE